jgi:hypothetical protein
MASFTGATPIAQPSRHDVTDYHPLMPGGGGGEPVDPKRYLLTGAGWVPIQ